MTQRSWDSSELSVLVWKADRLRNSRERRVLSPRKGWRIQKRVFIQMLFLASQNTWNKRWRHCPLNSNSSCTWTSSNLWISTNCCLKSTSRKLLPRARGKLTCELTAIHFHWLVNSDAIYETKKENVVLQNVKCQERFCVVHGLVRLDSKRLTCVR